MGRIGARRAEVLTRAGNARLVAVFDRDAQRAQELARVFGARVCEDAVELVTSRDIEAVIVATPHQWLAPISIAALEDGKHVLCEKPLARTAEEGQAVVEAAARTGRTLKIGFNHRFHPAIAEARRLAKCGRIGRLLLMRCRYGHGGRTGYEHEWRADPAASGGGELMDQGIHALDLFRWFAGEFSEVTATLARAFWPAEVEDNAFCLLRSKAGAVASLHASWTQWRNLFSFEVFGDVGYLQVEGLGGNLRAGAIDHRRTPLAGSTRRATSGILRRRHLLGGGMGGLCGGDSRPEASGRQRLGRLAGVAIGGRRVRFGADGRDGAAGRNATRKLRGGTTMQNGEYIGKYLRGIREIAERIDQGPLDRAVELLWDAWERGATVFLCGNGGSAGTATHFAADLFKCTIVADQPRLRVISLVDNAPLMSALVNDDGWENVYTRQLETLFRPGDVLITISVHGGSGRDHAALWSQNLLRAMEYARAQGGRTIGLGGLHRRSDARVGRCGSGRAVRHHAARGIVPRRHPSPDHVLSRRAHSRARRSGEKSMRQAAFLDRDGVLNALVERDGRHVSPLSDAEFALLPGTAEAVRAIRGAGLLADRRHQPA